MKRKFDIKRYNIKKYILIVLAGIIFACDLYFDNHIIITSFEQCIYAIIKLEGSSSSSIVPAIVYIVIASVILCLLFLMPAIDFGKKLVINIKNKCIQLYPIVNTKIYGIVLLVLAIIGLFYVFDVFSFIKNTVFSSTEIFDDYYVDAHDVDISFPDKMRVKMIDTAEST